MMSQEAVFYAGFELSTEESIDSIDYTKPLVVSSSRDEVGKWLAYRCHRLHKLERLADSEVYRVVMDFVIAPFSVSVKGLTTPLELMSVYAAAKERESINNRRIGPTEVVGNNHNKLPAILGSPILGDKAKIFPLDSGDLTKVTGNVW
jgi:hypothetical protein